MQNFFFGKRLFEYKFRFALEKKTKKNVWSNFKTFIFSCRHQKMLVIQFPYMGLV